MDSYSSYYSSSSDCSRTSEHRFDINISNSLEYRRAHNKATSGNTKAQLALALYYGTRGDLQKAFIWTKRAAEQGDAEGQCVLGDLFYDGIGVDEDKVKALEYFIKAARAGNEEAENKDSYLL